MIKAILFDFRDTLLRVDKAYRATEKALMKFICARQKITQKKLKLAFSETITSIIKYYQNKPTLRTKVHNWNVLYLKDLFSKLDIVLSKEKFSHFLKEYDDAFINNASLYPDARYMLNYCQKNKIVMGVVIDGTKKRERDIIKKLNLKKYFKAIAISEEIGQNKFTTLPLQTALKKIGVAHKQILVVGDRIDKDILHANKLGCASVKLERHKGRYTNKKALKPEEKPRYVINNLKELVSVLKT